MLDIAYGFLFVFMICGLIGYKLTANIAWGMIFLIPGFLLGLFLIIEIVVNIYYEKHVQKCREDGVVHLPVADVTNRMRPEV